MDDKTIRVTGLREVASALRAVEKDGAVALKVGLREIAAEVVSAVQGKVPHQSGKAAGSYKPRSTQSGAGIAFGGQAAPYAPWLDFGGSTGPGHQPRRPGSGSIKREWLGRPVGDGRYLYPTISEHRDETIHKIDELIERVISTNGFKQRGGN